MPATATLTPPAASYDAHAACAGSDTCTVSQYITLQAAFDFFNDRLFDGILPACILTLEQKANSRGYFSPGAWTARDGGKKPETRDTINLSPESFAGRDDKGILSTLVHEMAHLWQEHNGKPGRGAYHNREWAEFMEERLGLIPQAINKPAGVKVGAKVTHSILPCGQFDKACDALLAGGKAIFWERKAKVRKIAKAKADSKVKYSCPGCGVNAWAKKGIKIACADCEEVMEDTTE